MLHHVVELHVVALELCQASRRVRWKTLDSLPVNQPNPAGGRREFYCVQYLEILLLYTYIFTTYL